MAKKKPAKTRATKKKSSSKPKSSAKKRVKKREPAPGNPVDDDHMTEAELDALFADMSDQFEARMKDIADLGAKARKASKAGRTSDLAKLVHRPDGYCNYWMSEAISQRDEDFAINMLAAGFCPDDWGHPDWEDKHEVRPLLVFAAENDCRRVIDELLNLFVDIDERGMTGDTALSTAASRGHLVAVKQLLDAGASLVNSKHKFSLALDAAAENGHEDVFEFLVKQPELSSKKYEKLVNAARKRLTVSSKRRLRQSRQKVPDHDPQIDELFLAIMKNRMKKVVAMVESGVNVNAVDDDGSTALYSALLVGNTEAAELLLQAGSDISLANVDGDTPMHAAVVGGMDCVKLVLEAGGKLDELNHRDETPIDRAVMHGHPEIAKMLIAAGVKVKNEKKTLSRAHENQFAKENQDDQIDENEDRTVTSLQTELSELIPTTIDSFRYPHVVENWTRDLKKLGFRLVGEFRIDARNAWMRGLSHSKSGVVCMLFENDARCSWGDLMTPYKDGTYEYYTGDIFASDASPQWQSLLIEDETPDEFFQRMIEDREDKPILRVTVGTFEKLFLEHDARLRQWRVETGGE